MPYSGTGTGRGYDVYRVRSAYAPGLAMQHAFSEREPFCDTPEAISFLKQYGQEYLKVRPFLTEDIYPLTECSDRTDIWCAVQYDRPQTGEGVIQIFRRERAPYETACFFLGGIQKEKQYHFWDADGGEFTACGSVLAQEGLRFTILTRRTAKLYFYKTF